MESNETRTPKLEDRVQVGGACGKIKVIHADEIVVAGVYIYSEGGNNIRETFSEPWSFSYNPEAFTKATWDEEMNWWDASDVQSDLNQSYVEPITPHDVV